MASRVMELEGSKKSGKGKDCFSSRQSGQNSPWSHDVAPEGLLAHLFPVKDTRWN